MTTKKKELVSNITVEKAKILFRNFSGKKGQYNLQGRREFCLLVDDDLGRTLSSDGWNIKELKPLEEGDPPQKYLPVGVAYTHFPPKIVLITKSRGQTFLDEDSVSLLDWAEIENIDLIIRPYNWEVNNKRGVKAYLKTMYVTIVEDPFEAKYNLINNQQDPSNEYEEPPF